MTIREQSKEDWERYLRKLLSCTNDAERQNLIDEVSDRMSILEYMVSILWNKR